MAHTPLQKQRFLPAALLLLSALVFALHFVDLRADFPNHSPWMDWSKYTDEGWYGDAAIRFFQLGHWYVAGDFNPAAALPVWPLMEAVLFRFTGVSLLAARAFTVCIFGLICLCSALLIRRWTPGLARRGMPVAAAVAVLLLVVSPFCFVFTRLAILEPPLILFMLLSLLTASSMEPAGRGSTWIEELRRNLAAVICLAVLIPVMILTKTTAMFLMPAIFWMLFAALQYRIRSMLHLGLPVMTLAGALWGVYFFGLIRPHLLLDYRYLFSANAYSGLSWSTAGQVFTDGFLDNGWMGKALFWTAVAAFAWAMICWKRLREAPLVPALMLWAVGYQAFLIYHDNLQPRYYLVVAVPLTLLVPVVWQRLVQPRLSGRNALGAAQVLAGVWVVAITVPQLLQTISFLRNPEYTLLHAAQGVHRYIQNDLRTDPRHNPLLLSISGSDISLMTGTPSICDDFGTLDLVDRVDKYRPGWYAAWNQIDDDKMDALAPFFHVQRVAEFPAMDDPERNVLILYKLEPSPPHEEAEPVTRPTKPTPKKLRTRVGQQPSTSQLVH